MRNPTRSLVLAGSLLLSACSPGDAPAPDAAINADAGTNTSAVIGSSGGLVAGDHVRLGIPEGALTEDTEIRIIRVGEAPAGFDAYSALYRFEPQDLTFLVPVTVEVVTDQEAGDAALFWSIASGTRYDRILGTASAPDRFQAQVTSLRTGFVASRFVGTPRTFPQDSPVPVDMLFVIDNSGSMADEQALLLSRYSDLMNALKVMTGGLPDVHLGVTSTNLGTYPFNAPLCEVQGGDAGRLLTGDCANPMGARYLVDVEPQGCEVARSSDGGTITCPHHTCTQAHCDAVEPGSALYTDEGYCPRCRNYSSENLADSFTCLAMLGTQGCGFTQPLEAMLKALDGQPANAGFLRDDSLLAVVFVTDDDDCSASDPQLFDNTQTEMDSELGPFSGFRCFEFGVTCDVNDRTTEGERHECAPRTDGLQRLFPIDRYTEFLRLLRPDGELLVDVIAGPLSGGSVMVAHDVYDHPEVQSACSGSGASAKPIIRLERFLSEVGAIPGATNAAQSICGDPFTIVADRLREALGDPAGDQCLPGPPAGCLDVGYEFGQPGTGCPQYHDRCLAQCYVTEIRRASKPDEVRLDVPPCLEVCPEGPCEGNTDWTIAYKNGHPERVDLGLPVPACWHVSYQPACTDSNGAEVIIARQTNPPLRTLAEISCVPAPVTEVDCADGLDEDGDCLADADDPDCVSNPGE